MTPDARPFSPSSRARLTSYDLQRFAGTTLFDRIGRAVCEAGCLPRKELYEAWEVARRTRRRFRGGRVVDMAAGHGLLAQMMLLLDRESPEAVAIDAALPASAARVHDALTSVWPWLRGRMTFVNGEPETVPIRAGDIVVSCQACGNLTDRVIAAAVSARARVAVLPCCHDLQTCDAGGLTGWLDAGVAIDVTRAATLRAAGYDVRTQQIPAAITTKNRLLLAGPAQPRRGQPGGHGR